MNPTYSSNTQLISNIVSLVDLHVVYCWDTSEFSKDPILEFACCTIHSTLIYFQLAMLSFPLGDTSCRDNEQDTFLCPHSVAHSLSYSCVTHSLSYRSVTHSLWLSWLFYSIGLYLHTRLIIVAGVSGLGCRRRHRKVALLDWSNSLPYSLHPSWVNWTGAHNSGRRFFRGQWQLWHSSYSFMVSVVLGIGVAENSTGNFNQATASFSWQSVRK